MYSDRFAADPHDAYRKMRLNYGSLVPVDVAPEVPATLVIGYEEAVRILNDPDRFPVDPRGWQQSLPADSPIRPLLEWHPNARRNSGAAHARYRAAYADSIEGIDLNTVRSTVEQIAIPLINDFCETGTADLVTQYAFPLVFEVLNRIVGCSAELGQRIMNGMTSLYGAVDSAWGRQYLGEAFRELIAQKRESPGEDATSILVQHRADLDDEELVANLFSFYEMGLEPQQNLIVNTLLLMLTDGRFGGDMLGGSLATRDALDEVLFNDPPIANFCTTFPRQPVLIGNAWLSAQQPVVISLAGCNTDPAIRGADHVGNRSHLAWGVGPHACPAQSVASVVVQEAIDQLLDALPELELAISIDELMWRPSPFHRALAALPVNFPESPPLHIS